MVPQRYDKNNFTEAKRVKQGRQGLIHRILSNSIECFREIPVFPNNALEDFISGNKISYSVTEKLLK